MPVRAKLNCNLKFAAALLLAVLLAGALSLSAHASPQIMPDGASFDAEFYAQTYPDAVYEVGTGQAQLYWHYVTYGKAKGYLPYASTGASDGCILPYRADGYNYLAIGNSILNHPVTEYWWGEYGMAASAPENDYFHRVSAYLTRRYGNVYTANVRFGAWETAQTEAERSLYLSALAPYLSPALDLVTIQVSENVNDLDTLAQSYPVLIAYVKALCPNAKIILVDDFWDAEKSAIKKEVAAQLSLPFADLSFIRGRTQYQSRIGAPVFAPEGSAGIVLNDFVAQHPNDRGMNFIAGRIISASNKPN